MSNLDGRIIRRHKRRSDDGKGIRRLIAGRRFRATAGVDPREAEQRFLKIEALWRDNEQFCSRIGRPPQWTDIAIWAAEALRKGEVRVSLPPIDDILASYEECGYPETLNQIVWRHTDEQLVCHCPPTVDRHGLTWDEAKHFYDVVSDAFPSVNWLLPEHHATEIMQSHEQQARWSLNQLAKAKNQASPDPTTPLVSGTLHETLEAYEEERRKDFTLPDGSFDGSGHHMLGMIRSMRERINDFPLAELDFTRCQTIVDFWRNRPKSQRDDMPLSRKTCGNYLGELKRFFGWLHLTNKFGWRKPEDFEFLKFRVRSLPSDRPSLEQLEIETYSIKELALLYKYAIPFERLLLVWGLNCAHGAAEFGRVEWEDLCLNQEHPWRRQGLALETGEADSWCGFIRPKSDVLGWWLLWPETVGLLAWWRGETNRHLHREPIPGQRVLLTKTGSSLYRDETRNAQTGFANAWSRLLDRVQENEGQGSIRRLAFGTLRNQLPDWLGGEQARAVVASVALCHGIPHKGDKLLYRHYSNRPWAALFKAQRDFRDHLRLMFEASPDPLAEYDPLAEKVKVLWSGGEQSVRKMAGQLGVSEMAIRRRLKATKLYSGGKPGRPRRKSQNNAVAALEMDTG